MKTRVRDIVEQGDRLFSKRGQLLSLWQSMAENFYPQRADFTTSRSLGTEFASYLMSGTPVLAHRDLGNSLSAMLRPRGQAWFHARTNSEGLNKDAESRKFLDWISDVMRIAMYDQRSQFVRATKEGDHDFVAFGQCVISVEPNQYLDGILYRTWHLRDVAWCESAELRIDNVHRNWKPEARQQIKLFPKTVSPKVRELLEREPYREIKCRHIIIPEDEYDLSTEKKGRRNRLPFTSIYVDCENEVILEEVPAKRVPYVIPRWQTVSGSQYAHSPATVVALPDARMLQQITLTLLEAGQKAVDPPMKATSEAISGGVNMYAGGITWVDNEYDEKMGAALEPVFDPAKLRLDWGAHREEKVERLIAEAFFLNVINLPQERGKEMTAYETQERVKEYVRRVLPLFEPMEVEYNGALCEATFDLCSDLNMFGAFDDMPKKLSNQDIVWQFESPLQASNERIKSQQFMESANLLAVAAQMDQNARVNLDVDKAFRDALSGSVPSTWIVSEEQAAEAKQAAEQMQQAAAQAQVVAGVAGVAQQVGAAAEQAGRGASAIQEAGLAA